MLQVICERITDFIVKNNEKEQVDSEILRYGIELFMSDLLNFLVVFVISALFGHIVFGMFFFLTFAIMRKRTGGYHANTHLGCNIVLGTNTMIVMLVITLLGHNSNIMWGFLIVATIYSGISFLLLAPKENKNKQLDKDSRKLLKKRSMIIWLILCSVNVVLAFYDHDGFSMTLSCSMLSVAFALFPV
jgi:accessory gene regulator B